MRKIELKKIICDNFKCFTHKEVLFYGNTRICARNGFGKTTIANAYIWCLFDKDINGNTANGIRQQDKYGNDRNNNDISVTCTLDVDGREIEITKTQKKILNNDGTFKGNENSFIVNGIPKTTKEYKIFVKENICDEETFLYCTNAMSFYKLDTKKRRAILMNLSGTITNKDVIAKDNSFAEIEPLLDNASVEELIAKSRAEIKRLDTYLVSIPTRIDEQQKSMVDIDVSELELYINDLKNKIKELDSKKKDLAHNKNDARLLELRFDINAIKSQANDELLQRKREINEMILTLNKDIAQVSQKISECSATLSNKMSQIQSVKSNLVKQNQYLSSVQNRVFDAQNNSCPTCGRMYDEEQKNRIRDKFESEKLRQISEIEETISEMNIDIDKTDEEIITLKSEIDFYNKELSKLEQGVADGKFILYNTPDTPDLSNNDAYNKLKSEIEFIENNHNKDECEKLIHDIDAEIEITVETLTDANKKIALACRNDDIEERIDELRTKQRETSQKMANEQRILDMLTRFNLLKMRMLTDRINQHFKVVKWKLFKVLFNGNIEDCCKAYVNGVDREINLNDSDSLLADFEILSTLQEMNDISLPLFLDRAECINESRIPETKGQLIVLKVSDDKEMVVE